MKKRTVSSTTMVSGTGFTDEDLKTEGRILLTFTVGELNYRMRVAKVHVHPGDRDNIEVEGKDMLNKPTWTPVPDGGFGPSPEWLVRRALWCMFTNGVKFTDGTMMTVDMGKI